LTMRDHKRCCRLQIDEQTKLTQLDWLAKIFVKLTSFGNTLLPNDVKMPSRFLAPEKVVTFLKMPNSVRRRREGPKGRVGRRVQKRQRGKGFRVLRE